MNVALGLGVADVCCRFGMAPFRIRPLHRYQICLDEICFLLNGLGDKIVRTWCCRGCGRRALGFMCAPRAKPPTATSGVLLTTVSAVRGRRARVTAENRNPPTDWLATEQRSRRASHSVPPSDPRAPPQRAMGRNERAFAMSCEVWSKNPK